MAHLRRVDVSETTFGSLHSEGRWLPVVCCFKDPILFLYKRQSFRSSKSHMVRSA